MKTQTMTNNNTTKMFSLFALLLMLLLATNSLFAQQRTVTGIVEDETGPLEGATVVLKGSHYAVNTNAKGEFTFPKPLQQDDRLVVIQLGYKDQEVTIEEDTQYVRFNLTDQEVVILTSLMIGSNATPKEDSN